MHDPFLLLFGATIIAVAMALGVALTRGDNRPAAVHPPVKALPPQGQAAAAHGVRHRWGIAGCVTLAAIGLDVAVVYGIDTVFRRRAAFTMR